MPTLTAFNVTEENKDQIRELIKRARENIVDYETLGKAIEEDAAPVGDTPENRVQLGSYKVVFTIEECAKDKLFKHMSVSCQSIIDGRVLLPPIPLAVNIMKMFGFKNADNMMNIRKVPEEDVFHVWKETVREGIEAINIVELDSVGVEPDFKLDFDLALGLG